MDRPLTNLRELHVCSAWNYQSSDWGNERFKYHLSINGCPVHFFRIPSIQRLSVFDLFAVNAAEFLETEEAAAKSSSITDLTLVYNEKYKFTLSGWDTSALLAVPKMLVNLCIHWDDPNSVKARVAPKFPMPTCGTLFNNTQILSSF